jgi:serine/threonine protein kinase/tetratricopeptide (TPR) repeat protein
VNPKRWREIERLYHLALDKHADERAAFLERTCGENAALRREVESLLAQRQNDESFLEVPALEAAARALAQDQLSAAEAGESISGTLSQDRLASHEAGDLIGNRFILAKLAAAGGMGEVYCARDERLSRLVALKFINPELALQPESRRRLEREAQAICSLAHPRICTLYDLAWEGDIPFLIMEYIVGETLADRIARGPLPPIELLQIACEIAEGLVHAHARGIVHRDLKPRNIMLTDIGVKILDFGIAKRSYGPALSATALTRSGVVMGSTPYMSPEQAEGKLVDERTDIFSFGCLLYEMVTGIRAFQGDSPISTLAAILRIEPKPIRDIVPLCSPELTDLVATCLKKDRAERSQTMTGVYEQIHQLWNAHQQSNEDLCRRRQIPPRGNESSRQNIFWSAVARTRVRGVLVSALLILLCVLAIRDYRRNISRVTNNSVAILPFVNVANDQDLEYLTDGLTESIINALSRLHGVRVIARTTAFTYKGRSADVRQIGAELHVGAVVTGQVSRKSDQLRIQADLVDAVDGTQLWGEQYSGTFNNLLHIQEELVTKLSDRLEVELTNHNRSELRRQPTHNTEAYRSYLKGRHALLRASIPELKNSIQQFQNAIELDPTYAQAYAGLADSYFGLSGSLRPKEAMAKARAAATRALEIDPASSEAYVSLGVIDWSFDYDWAKAEEELRRAIELNPNNSAAHFWHGWMLVTAGHFQEGIAQAQLAQDLDPLSVFVETGLGQMYYLSRNYAEAIKRLKAVVDADPTFYPGHHFLGVTYLYTQQYAEAVRELERATQLDEHQVQSVAYLAFAQAMLGQRQTAMKQLVQLKKEKATRYVSGNLFAVAYLGLGAYEEALQSLNEAYAAQDDTLVLLKVDSIFDPLRSDSRFAKLLDQIRF